MTSLIRQHIFVVGCSLLVCLSACAGGGVPLPKDEAKAEFTDSTQTSISRLEQGRTGFIINESYQYSVNQQELFTLGVDALKSGKYDVAIDCFRSITEAAPLHSSPYINLAIAYIGSGKDELAEEPLKKALGMVSGHPVASHEYGLLLRRAGRFDEARTVYERSLKRFPEYFPLRKNLGILCDLYLNDRKCATRQYQSYLQAQPDDEQVKLWLTEVQSR